MEKRFLLYILVFALLASVGVSCNKDDEEDDSSVGKYTSSSTAITEFNLVNNSKILANLDSIFFTIDLENARIYNADSLPKGTDVSRMLAEITCPTCYSVEVSISNAERMNDTTFVYSNSDTIDFTGDVKIKVTALDEVTYRTYDVKVNVHQLESDSLQWGDVAYSSLPSMHGNVSEQKTVRFGDKAYCLMVDDGYYVLATTGSLSEAWNKQEVEMPFTPDVRSFTAGSDALYILSSNHDDMYASTDGINWTSCGGLQWRSIIGAYDDRVLGVAYDGNTYFYDEYPRRMGFAPSVVADGFPVEGTSNLAVYDNIWGDGKIGVCIGGLTADSEYVQHAWGYDGNSWSVLSNNEIGGHEGMSLLLYTTFDTNESHWSYTAYPTLMAWGGRTDDGELSRTMYVSLDMGVYWSVADSLLQLPECIPAMYRADALVFNFTMEETRGSVAGAMLWRMMSPMEMPVWYNTATPVAVAETRNTASGIAPVTEWEVPYIYVFGGYDEYGNTYDTVWRGVLNRLSYKPVY